MTPHNATGDPVELSRLLKLLNRVKGRIPTAGELLETIKNEPDCTAWIGSRRDSLGRRYDISALAVTASEAAPQVKRVSEAVTTEAKHRLEMSFRLNGEALTHSVLFEQDTEQVVSIVFTEPLTGGIESPIEQINRLSYVGYRKGEIADRAARAEISDFVGRRSALIMTIDESVLRKKATNYALFKESEEQRRRTNEEKLRNLFDAVFPTEFEWDYARSLVRAKRKTLK